MKILIITRLKKTPEEEEAATAAHAALNALDDSTVRRDEELDWQKLREVEGSYEGAYRWAAQNFDRIVAIEAPGQVLAKGQSSIVEHALAAGTPCAVWRGEQGFKVVGVERIAGGDWKTGYGRVVLG